MTENADERAWITLRAVARLLDTSTRGATLLARTGRVRSRLLPGSTYRQYARADVLRIKAESEEAARDADAA